jgi:uncharacterized protein (TIGR02145 family)
VDVTNGNGCHGYDTVQHSSVGGWGGGSVLNSKFDYSNGRLFKFSNSKSETRNLKSEMRNGAFYQWDELMQYQTVEGAQGLCTPGWHVPSETEWATMINYYQGNGRAGSPLQDTIINGFKALRSGVFYLNSSWSFLDFATILWSSTASGQSKAISHGMNLYNFSVSLYPAGRGNAFGVRCLRDY